MSIHRATLFALAALFTGALTSAASAGCCGVEVQAPVTYAHAGCGGCGTSGAVIVYARPVAPTTRVLVRTAAWGTGCGCHAGIVYATPVTEPMPIEPAPIYVVNQGPEFSGPGIMVPYHTWSPYAGYVVPGSYPYFHGYRHGHLYRHLYRRETLVRHMAYREHVHPHWRMLRPLPATHAYPHHRYR
jgi:hypothetical protein